MIRPEPIKIGEKLPTTLVKHITPTGVQDMNTDTLFLGKKVVLFGLPGAFTPTCTTKHVPGYVAMLDTFKQRDINVVCLSVNDPFVMRAWFESMNVPAEIKTLCDGNATFTRALGLGMDGGVYGLGIRSMRFALYAEDGIVRALFLEKPGEFKCSTADYVLAQLTDLIGA